VAEIGSWFIPITRLGTAGKVEKLGNAVLDMPKVSALLGTKANVVKSNGKFFYEVGKDVTDVAILETLRGSSWEEIKQDMLYAGLGGAGIRGTGASIATLLKKGKANRLIKVIEENVGGLDDAEKKSLLVAYRRGIALIMSSLK
jgi:hypothetical protein